MSDALSRLAPPGQLLQAGLQRPVGARVVGALRYPPPRLHHIGERHRPGTRDSLVAEKRKHALRQELCKGAGHRTLIARWVVIFIKGWRQLSGLVSDALPPARGDSRLVGNRQPARKGARAAFPVDCTFLEPITPKGVILASFASNMSALCTSPTSPSSASRTHLIICATAYWWVQTALSASITHLSLPLRPAPTSLPTRRLTGVYKQQALSASPTSPSLCVQHTPHLQASVYVSR